MTPVNAPAYHYKDLICQCLSVGSLLHACRKDGYQQVMSLFDIVKRWINTVAFKRLHALPKYGHGWREEKDTSADMLPFPLERRLPGI